MLGLKSVKTKTKKSGCGRMEKMQEARRHAAIPYKPGLLLRALRQPFPIACYSFLVF